MDEADQIKQRSLHFSLQGVLQQSRSRVGSRSNRSIRHPMALTISPAVLEFKVRAWWSRTGEKKKLPPPLFSKICNLRFLLL
jgi:hypothetical protein